MSDSRTTSPFLISFFAAFVLAAACVPLSSISGASPESAEDARVLDAVKYATGTMLTAARPVKVAGVQILPMVYDTDLDRDRDGQLDDTEMTRFKARLASFASDGVWKWGAKYRWKPGNARVSHFCCLDQETYHPFLRSLGARSGSIANQERYYRQIVEAAERVGPAWAEFGIWGLPPFEMTALKRSDHDHLGLTRSMQAVMPSCYLPDWREGRPNVRWPVPMIERIRRDVGPDTPIVAFVSRHKAGGHPKDRPNAPEARMSAAEFREYCGLLLDAGADHLALWESYRWDRTQETESQYRAMLRESLEIMVEVAAARE